MYDLMIILLEQTDYAFIGLGLYLLLIVPFAMLSRFIYLKLAKITLENKESTRLVNLFYNLGVAFTPLLPILVSLSCFKLKLANYSWLHIIMKVLPFMIIGGVFGYILIWEIWGFMYIYAFKP